MVFYEYTSVLSSNYFEIKPYPDTACIDGTKSTALPNLVLRYSNLGNGILRVLSSNYFEVQPYPDTVCIDGKTLCLFGTTGGSIPMTLISITS